MFCTSDHWDELPVAMGDIEWTVWCALRTQLWCKICGYHHLPLLAAKITGFDQVRVCAVGD